MGLKLVTAIAVLLTVTIAYGNALKCMDLFPGREPKEVACDGSCASSTNLDPNDGEIKVAATCVPVKMTDMCAEIDGSDVCYCNTDLCNNGASGLRTFIVTWLLVLIAVIGKLCLNDI